jgi:hypothetical protein
VVAGGAGDRRAHLRVGERVVRRSEEVAEEDQVVQDRLTDLDDVEPRRVRQPALAAEAQHLAALREARARQPP